MSAARVAEYIWYGDGPVAGVGRVLLAPLGWAFAGVARLRGALYSRGILESVEPELPALGVGNLTVGGTGKTPLAADIARRLGEAGGRPAIVLRGYGGDEPLVHRLLNPRLPVVAAADRVEGVREAAAAGADMVVLDDAFQHRRLRRQADIVLVSADRWSSIPPRSLPAGPWREGLRALRRASLAVVTAKAASAAQVDGTLKAIAAAAPDCPVAVARLALDELVAVEPSPTAPVDGTDGRHTRSERRSLAWLAGRRVVVAAAIGDPSAFIRQLEGHGAIPEPHVWADHHSFSGDDVMRLTEAARDTELVLCTLKDAVKLAPLWPRAGPLLWYVSQTVSYELGEQRLRQVIDGMLAASSSRS